MPHVHRVGIVPVRTSIEDSGFSKLDVQLKELFSEAVRNANRFRVLDDDLVAGLWDSEPGRNELVSDFELDAFVSLSVTNQGDIVVFDLHLLGPELQSYLFESERVPRLTLEQFNRERLISLLETLTFRTFNRLPVDVTITSVQGVYVTLSGGQNQGVQNGDQIKVIRPTVASIHPANGTWLSYNRKPLGTIEVMDSKTQTAVAKITSQVYDGAIRLGDGAKVKAIAGRARFAAEEQQPKFRDAGEQGTIVVPPLFQEKPLDAEANPTLSKPDESQSPTPGASLEQQPLDPTTPKASGLVAGDDPSATAASDGQAIPASDDEFALHEMFKGSVEDVTFKAGAYQWSIAGPANATGKFPLWLVNNLSVGFTRTVFYKLRFGLEGGGYLGNTDKGFYVGYDATGKFYWHDKIDIGDPGLSYWEAGGFGNLAGMKVTDEFFGGGDGIRGGGFVGLGGMFPIDSASAIDWFSELRLTPLHIGRIGYNDKQRNVESTFGWQFSAGGYYKTPATDINYGGALSFAEERLTLTEGERPKLSAIRALFLVRYQVPK